MTCTACFTDIGDAPSSTFDTWWHVLQDGSELIHRTGTFGIERWDATTLASIGTYPNTDRVVASWTTDPDDNLYLTTVDGASQMGVYKRALSSAAASTLLGSSFTSTGELHVAWSEYDGLLYLVRRNSANTAGSLYSMDPSTGARTELATGLTLGGANLKPTIGGDGGVWFPRGTNGVYRWDPDALSLATTTAVSGNFKGNVYVATKDGDAWYYAPTLAQGRKLDPSLTSTAHACADDLATRFTRSWSATAGHAKVYVVTTTGGGSPTREVLVIDCPAATRGWTVNVGWG